MDDLEWGSHYDPAKPNKTRQAGTRCYQTHKPLPIGDKWVFGGSCITPVVLDADVYVGFDSGMAGHHSLWPWSQAQGCLYRITDMSVPDDLESFKALIDWLSQQIHAAKKVHLGCIGGHGRTGLVMAALVKQMMGVDDAIRYVRQHYCDKAVETAKQVEWLHQHFGITKAEAHKMEWGAATYAKGYGKKDKPKADVFKPIKGALNIWAKLFDK